VPHPLVAARVQFTVLARQEEVHKSEIHGDIGLCRLRIPSTFESNLFDFAALAESN
jgi:hypothetical protein